jgi:positive regulator of sigma E activity
MFPLVLFLVGLLGVQYILPGAGEGFQALGGFAGLLIGFGVGYLFGRLKKRTYQPIITSIHGQAAQELSI